MKFIKWSAGDCKAQLDSAVQLATFFDKAALATRWREIDLDSYKGAAATDNRAISWIVVEEDGSNNISSAFNKEIHSYLLDSLPAPVRYEKRKNPQFAHLKPGWGLYDGKNHILAYSEEPPSHDLISGMAKSNGIVSKVEEFERFRRANDRNALLDAELLKEYLALANKRMARFNQSNPEKPMLTDEEDNIIWGPAARVLEDLLGNDNYRYVLLLRDIQFLDTATQSQTMKRLAAKHIYAIEEMIKRDPVYIVNYPLWFSLNELADNRHSLINTLLDLAPVPGESLVFNPQGAASIIGQITKEAQKHEEWDFILSNSPHYWNYFSRWWKSGYPKNYDDALSLLGPYIEALLATDNVAEAEIVFSEFMDAIPSGDIQSKLAALASKWKKPDLAKKWGDMRPKQ
jgi:hypothetical protein